MMEVSPEATKQRKFRLKYFLQFVILCIHEKTMWLGNNLAKPVIIDAKGYYRIVKRKSDFIKRKR